MHFAHFKDPLAVENQKEQDKQVNAQAKYLKCEKLPKRKKNIVAYESDINALESLLKLQNLCTVLRIYLWIYKERLEHFWSHPCALTVNLQTKQTCTILQQCHFIKSSTPFHSRQIY